MPTRIKQHRQHNEHLNKWGWRRDKRGRWHKGSDPRSYTRRQALLAVSLVRQPQAQPKAGPTTAKPDKVVSRVRRYSNDTLVDMVSRQKTMQLKKLGRAKSRSKKEDR